MATVEIGTLAKDLLIRAYIIPKLFTYISEILEQWIAQIFKRLTAHVGPMILGECHTCDCNLLDPWESRDSLCKRSKLPHVKITQML